VKAIVMAGGFGTRLRPLTMGIPKPMVPIGNVPMMEHVILLLKQHGITDITALLYYQPEIISNHFGDGSSLGLNISYVLPDDDYGTAGAVRCAAADMNETVLVISGDLVTDFDLGAAIAWHRERQSEATILLTRIENPLAYGIVITESDGRIARFLEKPTWSEAFSDTINTGVYILEPGAVELIPPKRQFDFSQNLFPLMLTQRRRLYGMITSGYWKDVGNVDEYRRTHQDLFSGGLHLDFRSELRLIGAARVYVGENVRIEDGVQFGGTVILGSDTRIDSGAKLHNCAVGARSRIGRAVDLRESVIWSDVLIGAGANFNSVIVCNRSRIGERVHLLENAIISEDCTIGSGSTVKANCKIWPNKTVDEGATVSSSLVWGDKWNRELFTDSKVTGLALSEITPEMSVRLGAAFGAMLGQGTSVVTSRDASDVSRLLRRGVISGLLSAGINVSDLEAMPIPIMRYALTKGKFAAGIYVRHNPDDYRQLDIIVIDGSGLDMPPAKLKKIERNYFGEDYELAPLDKIGHLDTPQRVLDDYRQDFLATIDVDLMKKAGFKVVVDHSNGASAQIFPALPTILGISSVDLNGSQNPRKFSSTPEEQGRQVVQLSSIVTSLNADVGFLFNPAAEKITVIDETGTPLDPQLLLLIVTDLFVQTASPKKIAVPVGASMGIEEIARRYGVEVIRTAGDHLSMMEARRRGQADFVGGTRGGFIFPGFQMGADAIFSAIKILEMLARAHTRIGELRSKYEHFVRKSVSVPCPWSKKGTVMRRLITDSSHKRRQLIDGVRIFEETGWVLVAPDRMKASFNILAESLSDSDASRLINQYRTLVEESQSN
jgi:mannose-1-phosphate guanylyltransferase/phosphomannomutase